MTIPPARRVNKRHKPFNHILMKLTAIRKHSIFDDGLHITRDAACPTAFKFLLSRIGCKSFIQFVALLPTHRWRLYYYGDPPYDR